MISHRKHLTRCNKEHRDREIDIGSRGENVRYRVNAVRRLQRESTRGASSLGHSALAAMIWQLGNITVAFEAGMHYATMTL